MAIGNDRFWSSADGRSWETAGPPQPETIWQDLLALEDGSFLAVGISVADATRPRLVRVANDAVTDIPIEGPNDYAASIERYGDEFLIVGGEESGGGLAWTSPDGDVWSRARLEGVPFLTLQAVSGTNLVSASVYSAPEQGNGRTEMFHSVDGSSWVRTAEFIDTGATGLLAIGNEFLVIGNVAGSDQFTLNGAAWWSDDGGNWAAMATPALDGVLSSATSWRGVPFAVGYTLAEGQQEGVIWAAVDRASWRPIVGAPAEGSRLQDIVVIGDQLVIVGSGTSFADEPVILIGKPG